MKRLIIICEGPTESEFCVDVLAPALLQEEIYVEAPKIKKSSGGIVPWQSLKRQIELHLHEGDARVSLLIDYYGIKDSYNFPGWQQSKDIENPTERIHFLCGEMNNAIAPELRDRFIPYIQLHEFESLLFSDINVFKANFTKEELDIEPLEKAVREFENPEDINTRPTLAPSKRIQAAVEGYEKVIYGACLAYEIGLEKISEQCPLFNEWVTKIKSI